MTAEELLSHRSHRPFPIPNKPWVMRQEWHDLLFAHWALPAEVVRRAVPPELSLDLWNEQAYVGVIPFRIANLRPRGMPVLPMISHFGEINLRTYVTVDGKPGVYFFSLDAENLSAVLGARLFYSLPYFKAEFNIGVSENQVLYRSQRAIGRKPAKFLGRYGPVSEVVPFRPMAEAVERFVSERYCLYTVIAGRVCRTHIHHLPWPLQKAEASIEINTIATTVPLALEGPPQLMHFSKFLDVLVWWPEQVS